MKPLLGLGRVAFSVEQKKVQRTYLIVYQRFLPKWESEHLAFGTFHASVVASSFKRILLFIYGDHYWGYSGGSGNIDLTRH